MTPEQFERLIDTLDGTDWWGIALNVVAIVASVGIAIWSARDSEKSNRQQLILERRFDAYSELAGYLQELTADHDQAIKLRSKIYGLITKTYFFASQPINALFQEFLDKKVYDKEIQRVVEKGKYRDRSFNEFDAYIWTVIECMKYEAREKQDITAELREQERAKQFTKIGSDQHTDVIVRNAKESYKLRHFEEFD